MPIEFPGQPKPITQADLDNLAVFEDQIKARHLMKRRLADAMLDRLAAGATVDGYLTVRREVLKHPDDVTEERLVVGSVVRHKRLTGAAGVLVRARPD